MKCALLANHPTRPSVKKLILFVVIASLCSLNVHADWDPVREAQDAAAHKASQQRAAGEKAEADKRKRDFMQKHMREFVGKDAAGKSDADVERLYKQRRAELDKQAANMNQGNRNDQPHDGAADPSTQRR